VRYEWRFLEGGGRTFWGPVLARVEGDAGHSEADKETLFYCPIRRGMVPIPAGYALPYIEDDEDPFII
jgi:hypothetical protein